MAMSCVVMNKSLPFFFQQLFFQVFSNYSITNNLTMYSLENNLLANGNTFDYILEY